MKREKHCPWSETPCLKYNNKTVNQAHAHEMSVTVINCTRRPFRLSDQQWEGEVFIGYSYIINGCSLRVLVCSPSLLLSYTLQQSLSLNLDWMPGLRTKERSNRLIRPRGKSYRRRRRPYHCRRRPWGDWGGVIPFYLEIIQTCRPLEFSGSLNCYFCPTIN